MHKTFENIKIVSAYVADGAATTTGSAPPDMAGITHHDIAGGALHL